MKELLRVEVNFVIHRILSELLNSYLYGINTKQVIDLSPLFLNNIYSI